jgi:hypothetical protein
VTLKYVQITPGERSAMVCVGCRQGGFVTREAMVVVVESAGGLPGREENGAISGADGRFGL